MNIFNDPRYPTTWTNDEILAAERREQALNDAYAAGRADEREEWVPVLEALQKIAAIEHQLVGADWEEIEEAQEIARAAILKATGEQA